MLARRRSGCQTSDIADTSPAEGCLWDAGAFEILALPVGVTASEVLRARIGEAIELLDAGIE
jgi:hypothetical protein